MHAFELAPKYWPATRARLDPRQLPVDFGHFDIPLPLAPAAEQKPASD
jgi:hypothetical protein